MKHKWIEDSYTISHNNTKYIINMSKSKTVDDYIWYVTYHKIGNKPRGIGHYTTKAHITRGFAVKRDVNKRTPNRKIK